MTKIIFESKKPKFAVLVDEYQWILATHKRVRGNGDIEWSERTYHPNLANLFEYLAEILFKKNAKKVSQLKDMEKTIIKVYDLIEKSMVGLGEACNTVSQ